MILYNVGFVLYVKDYRALHVLRVSHFVSKTLTSTWYFVFVLFIIFYRMLRRVVCEVFGCAIFSLVFV